MTDNLIIYVGLFLISFQTFILASFMAFVFVLIIDRLKPHTKPQPNDRFLTELCKGVDIRAFVAEDLKSSVDYESSHFALLSLQEKIKNALTHYEREHHAH